MTTRLVVVVEVSHGWQPIDDVDDCDCRCCFKSVADTRAIADKFLARIGLDDEADHRKTTRLDDDGDDDHERAEPLPLLPLLWQ